MSLIIRRPFYLCPSGRWNPDGTLSIIDRAKNLVKQPSGEYVAVEKLEAEYNSDRSVKSVCVIADGDHDSVVAVVVPADKVFFTFISFGLWKDVSDINWDF